MASKSQVEPELASLKNELAASTRAAALDAPTENHARSGRTREDLRRNSHSLPKERWPPTDAYLQIAD